MSRTFYYLLFAILITACEEDISDETTSEYEGAKTDVGNGQAWTYVTVDDAGEPTSLGIRFTSSALRHLPTGSAHADEFLLTLPEEVAVPPFDHVTLDWNEKGHEPPGIYDIPHFDMHFYFISMDERNAIGPHDSVEFNKPLPPEHLAPDYMELPGGVPRMGAHIADLLSPEIAGTGTFTHTFIYGKYNARLNFMEPMVSLPFLETKSNLSKDIRHPERWQEEGYYPAAYEIKYEAETDTYAVTLTGLQHEHL